MKKYTPLFVLLCSALLLVFWLYGEVILYPNSYLFSNTGDGIKNYYTYAYHIKHGTSFVNLEGMNYPYGENFFFTDCQPILVLIQKSFSAFIPNISHYSIGILHELLIGSIFATFFAIYFLLREFKINQWTAVLFSIGITLLSPQIYRLPGHFGLSFGLAIPLAWLLYIRSIKNKPNLWGYLGLLILNIWWLMLHAYLGVIVCAFISLIIIVNSIIEKQRNSNTLNHLYLLVTTLLPIVILKTLISLTDNHLNRTDNPSGFFLYNAEPDDTFVPYYGPIRNFLDFLTNGIIKQEWEAKSYIGFAASLIFIYFIFTLIINKFKNKKFNLSYSYLNNKQLNSGLIAALILYIFSLGVPFKQFPDLLDIFAVLKQFRATGRFTWPFYYVASIFCAYIVFQYYVKLENKNKAYLGIIILMVYGGSIAWEGYYFHSEVAKSINKSPNYFNKSMLPPAFQKALNTINTSKYQAIISLPFYHYGSESYARPRQDAAVLNSLICSYHLGLPTTSASLVRASISESKKQVQLISPNYYPKAIQQDVTSEQPLLIIVSNNTSISSYETDLINKSELLKKTSLFDMYSISTENIFHDSNTNKYQAINQLKKNYIKKGDFLVSDSSSFLYYNDFEKTTSDTSFRGNGAYVGDKKGDNILAYFEPNSFATNTNYHLSIWMYNGEKDALNLWFRLMVEEYDVSSDSWHSTTIFPEHAETIFGNWSLVEATFTIKNGNNPVQIVTKGKTNSKATLHADDLLIKQLETNVIKIDSLNHSAFYNNHYIQVPSPQQ